MRVPATNVEVYIKEKLILLLSYLELFLKVFFNVLEENYVREIKNNCLVYVTAIFIFLLSFCIRFRLNIMYCWDQAGSGSAEIPRRFDDVKIVACL